jgi:lipopolysaccharide transport system permease protein
MKLKKETQRLIDLFIILFKREIILKYKRTALGFFWSLLNPLLTTMVLFVAFKIIMRFEMKNYVLFLLSAMFPWNWFAGSVQLSANALTHNASLIKKVLFPKHLLILSLVSSQLITLVCSLPILALLLFFYGSAPRLTWLYGIPLLILIQFCAITGTALLISVMNAYFRDIEHIIGVFLNMLFWLTPILYPLSVIPENLRSLLIFNPMFYLIQSWRDVIMGNAVPWDYLGLTALTSGVFLTLGIFVFNRMNKKLDEVI